MAHSGSLDSFGCTQAVGFIRGHWIHLRRPLGLCIHWGTLGPFGCTLGVVGVVLFFLVCPEGPLGSFGVVRLIRVCPQCRWVHSGAPRASLGTFGVVGFIRVHPGVVGFIPVHSGVPWGSLG